LYTFLGYGLRQNWWYDGRRDVYASTHAALDYLEWLHKRFKGDWGHALASYNAGPGTVGRSIRRNRKKGKATDFFSLRIPKETRDYVPKLVALAEVVSNPDKYGVQLRPIPDTPAISVVELSSQTDLAIAAKMMDLDMETLYSLNPAYNRWSTPPSGPHRFIIPLANVAALEHNLVMVPPNQRLTWQIHRVKPGETLSQIAYTHGTSVKQVMKANNMRSTMLSINQTLKIPRQNQPNAIYSHSQDQQQQRTKPGKTRITHRVQKGENLWSISRKYGVSTRSLIKWNQLPSKHTLAVNQTLTIWKKGNVSHSANTLKNSDPRYTKKIHYKVRRGESLSRIASKFSVPVHKISSWNPKTAQKRYLQPGDRLTLYVDIRH